MNTVYSLEPLRQGSTFPWPGKPIRIHFLSSPVSALVYVELFRFCFKYKWWRRCSCSRRWTFPPTDNFWKNVLITKCAGSSQSQNHKEYILKRFKACVTFLFLVIHLHFYWCCQQIKNLLALRKSSSSVRKLAPDSTETLGTLNTD